MDRGLYLFSHDSLLLVALPLVVGRNNSSRAWPRWMRCFVSREEQVLGSARGDAALTALCLPSSPYAKLRARDTDAPTCATAAFT